MYSNHGDKSQTIGTAGCGRACAAMVIATLRDKSVTPVETAAWAVVKGFRTKNDGTSWAFFPAIMKKYDIACLQTSSVSWAIAALVKNYMVISAAGKGIWTAGGHIFLAYGLSDDGRKVLINDPNSEAQYRELAHSGNYQSECVQFWIIEEEWLMPEIKQIEIIHSELGNVKVSAVNINGENYIRLRDTEKIAPITVDWDGRRPTVAVNYKTK